MTQLTVSPLTLAAIEQAKSGDGIYCKSFDEYMEIMSKPEYNENF